MRRGLPDAMKERRGAVRKAQRAVIDFTKQS